MDSRPSLAPGLLIAMPHKKRPRQLILLVGDDNDGAIGVAIDQPSTVSVRELAVAMGITWWGPRDAVVWRGGPLDPNSGWILHEPTPKAPIEHGHTFQLGPQLSLSTSPDRLRALAADPPARIRVVLGCNRWKPRALIREIHKEWWRHSSLVDPALVFDTPADKMWETAVPLVSSTALPEA